MRISVISGWDKEIHFRLETVAEKNNELNLIKLIRGTMFYNTTMYGGFTTGLSAFETRIIETKISNLASPYFSAKLITFIKANNFMTFESLKQAENCLIKMYEDMYGSYEGDYVSLLQDVDNWDGIDCSNFISCDKCWKVGEDVKQYSIDGRTMYLCGECYGLEVCRCPICGEEHFISNCSVLDGKLICKNCLRALQKRFKVSIYYCCMCQEWHTKQKYGKNRVNEHDWCCDNKARSLHTCSSCGVLSTRLNHSFCGTKLCNACYAKKEKYLIKSYHNDPVPEFYDVVDGKNQQVPSPNNGWGEYYGVELEVDSGGQRDDISEPTIKLLNDEVYAMRDGSLTNGFEIITHPHTEKALYNMPWEETFKFLVEKGYRSHDISTCGLHLHCNRSIFGDDQDEQRESVSKLMYFVENYRADFIKLSRREVQHINRWAKFYSDGLEKKDLKFYKFIYDNYNRSGRHDDRYRAINLCKKKTIEFRLIRGTLKLDTFFATLDILITISKNAKKIKEKDIDNKFVWLDGIRDTTREYIKENELFNGECLKQTTVNDIVADNPTVSSIGTAEVFTEGGRIFYRANGTIVDATPYTYTVATGTVSARNLWDNIVYSDENEGGNE